MAICDSFKKYTLYPALFYPDACGFSLAVTWIATAIIFAPNLRHSGCETRSLSGCWCNMRADRGYNEGASRVKYQ